MYLVFPWGHSGPNTYVSASTFPTFMGGREHPVEQNFPAAAEPPVWLGPARSPAPWVGWFWLGPMGCGRADGVSCSLPFRGLQALGLGRSAGVASRAASGSVETSYASSAFDASGSTQMGSAAGGF